MAGVNPEDIPGIIATNFSPMAEVDTPPRFKVGDKVRAVLDAKPTHTRLPRYLRGRVGTIVKHYGGMVFADTRALKQGDNPQHIYSVRFEGADVWGKETGGNNTFYADMYESYIENQ